MRLFYAREVKPYLLSGALITALGALIARFVFPAFAVQEIIWHTNLRNGLGHPFAYYSPLALIFLIGVYECFYAIAGGIIGYIVFRIKNRQSGFTLLFTKTFKNGSLILVLLLFYLFLRVDILNQYDATVTAAIPRPNISQLLSSQFVKTLSYIFLPSLRAVPERGFPKAQQHAQQSQNNPIPKTNTQTTQPTQTTGTTTQTAKLPTAAPKPTVQQTSQMPTATEIFSALNVDRASHGLTVLKWDPALADYAKSRADYFVSINATDSSNGFASSQGQNVRSIFHRLGQAATYGIARSAPRFMVYFNSYPATAGVLQDPQWNYAGVGVSKTAVVIVFADTKCADLVDDHC